MLQFFVKSIALPSNDPKLKKLQDNYFSELDKLTKSGGCSNCKRGALMRKYIPLIQEFYLSDEDYLDPKKRMELLNVNKLDKQIK
jgi:hypothetical protein